MGDNDGETLANIMRVKYDFDYAEFDEISEDARNFIRKLLLKTAQKRMTATQCLDDPWIKKAVNAIIALLRMGCVLHHPIYSNNSSQTEPDSPQAAKPSVNTLHSTTPVKSIPTSEKSKQVESPGGKSNKKDRKLTFSFRKPSFKRLTEKGNSSPERKRSPITKLDMVPENMKPEKDSPSRSTISVEPDMSNKDSVLNSQMKNTQSNRIPNSLEAQREEQTKVHSLQQKQTNNFPNESSQALKTRSSNLPTSANTETPKLNPSIVTPQNRKKVAPAIGGINAKIGFFSNLSKN